MERAPPNEKLIKGTQDIWKTGVMNDVRVLLDEMRAEFQAEITLVRAAQDQFRLEFSDLAGQKKHEVIQQVETETHGETHIVGIAGNTESANNSAEIQKEEDDGVVVTADRLDKGDMYTLAESVWDAAVFVGLPCVQLDVSLILLLAMCLNIFLQLAFMLIIYTYMLEDPVSSDILTGLLRFRAGIAHNVAYADHVSMTSMARQICDSDYRLPFAGFHLALFSDLSQFAKNGLGIIILAELIWVLAIVSDITGCLLFARSVWSVETSRSTKLVFAESDGSETDATGDNLHTLMVVARLKTMTLRRKFAATIFIVFPRLVIAILLGWIGIQYLSLTTNMEAAIMNCVALAFVVEIDELLYSMLIPRRVQCLQANLEPLRLITCPGRRSTRCASIGVISKVVLIFVTMFLVVSFILLPFFDRMSQANEILCGGQLDFVFAQSPASGVVTIAKSSGTSKMSHKEMAVLGVARPVLAVRGDWNPGEAVLNLVEGFNDTTQVPLAASEASMIFDSHGYDVVKRFATGDAEFAAETIGCGDGRAIPSESALDGYLYRLTGHNSTSSCDDYAFGEGAMSSMCSFYNMSELRALCPVACGCNMLTDAGLGFFGGPRWGCPSDCTQMKNAMQLYWVLQGYYSLCEDLKLDEWTDNTVISLYLTGVLEYLNANSMRSTSVFMAIEDNGRDILGFGENVSAWEVSEHFLSGQLVSDTFNGSWNIYEGLPHPRGKRGCEFWTSWEIGFVFGFDMCAENGEFRSIRFACPRSCHCSQTDSAGCPISCAMQPTDLPPQRGSLDEQTKRPNGPSPPGSGPVPGPGPSPSPAPGPSPRPR